jgi:hypothetical protein
MEPVIKCGQPVAHFTSMYRTKSGNGGLILLRNIRCIFGPLKAHANGRAVGDARRDNEDNHLILRIFIVVELAYEHVGGRKVDGI